MADLSEHFSTSEMCCPHCQRCSVSGRLIVALEQLRSLAGLPVVVHDACRCPVHNREVGGAENSEHLFYPASDGKPAKECIAADVSIPGLRLQQQYELAERVPDFHNGGIGVYDSNFVHVDVRDGRARWSRKNGVYLALNVLVIPVPASNTTGEVNA